MFTQPPYTFSDPPNPTEPVAENPGSPSQHGWSRFCPRAAAEALRGQLALLRNGDGSLMFPAGVTLNDETYSEAGYKQVGDNLDKVGVWTVTATRPAYRGEPDMEMDEWAAELLDRLIQPQDGIDQYPLGPNPTIHVSTSGGVLELFWSAAA